MVRPRRFQVPILSSAVRKKGYILGIQLYVDESGKLADSTYLAVGAVAAQHAEWQVLSDRWFARLEKSNLKCISMKDAINFTGNFLGWQDRVEERDTLLKDLATIARSLVSIIAGTATSTEEFRQQRPQKRSALMNDPVYACIEGCIRTIVETSSKEPIQLCIDNSEEYAVKCLQLYHKLRKHYPAFRQRCDLIAFGEDERLPGLQVADMIAYCERSRLFAPVYIIDEILRILSPTAPRQGSLSYSEGRNVAEGELKV